MGGFSAFNATTREFIAARLGNFFARFDTILREGWSNELLVGSILAPTRF